MNIISYTELVIKEGGKQVQKGMNFAIQKGYSIVLMSTEKMLHIMMKLLKEGLLNMKVTMYQEMVVSSGLMELSPLVFLEFLDFYFDSMN